MFEGDGVPLALVGRPPEDLDFEERVDR